MSLCQRCWVPINTNYHIYWWQRSGAVAYPRMTNDVVREFRTVIKYDRFQYQTSIQTWSSQGTYDNGTLVRYDNRVWSALNADGSSAVVGPTFDLENWQLVNAATYTYPGSTQATGLTGVDRTMGLYVPGANEPGLELPLLVDGVRLSWCSSLGRLFTGTQTLDANYQSEFADIYLGIVHQTSMLTVASLLVHTKDMHPKNWSMVRIRHTGHAHLHSSRGRLAN
jgi:hypothetical protein